MPNFLPKGKRIHLKLRKATLNRGGSSRQHNFNVELDLTEGDDVLTGLPEWIQNAYTNLVRVGNMVEMQRFDVVLNDYTLEFYSTARNRSKLFPVVLKAKLSKFVMTRDGEGDEDVEVKLAFTILFDTTRQINDWVFDEDDTDFWLATEGPQMDLALGGAEAQDGEQDDLDLGGDEDEDEDESEEDDDEDDADDEDEPIVESQSAKAARIRKEAEANAASAPPAARPALIGNVPQRKPAAFPVH